MSAVPAVVDPYDITVRSNGLRRRRIVEKVFGSLAFLAALLACGILAVVLGTLIYKGASQLNLDFFTKARPLFGQKGGVADALVGTALIVGMAMLMAIPFAVLVAIYMSEYAGPRVSRGLRIVLDVLNGVPAIVVGVFVFGLLVVGNGQSAIYGAFALAILMLPMVARATQEILGVVPQSLRHASLALGVTKWRTTWNIILPAAIGGILTGVVISVARVAGETAPLLFTSSIAANQVSFDVHGALPTLPVTIYVNSESPDPGRAGFGMGRGPRPHRFRPRDEHPRQGVRRPEAATARRELNPQGIPRTRESSLHPAREGRLTGRPSSFRRPPARVRLAEQRAERGQRLRHDAEVRPRASLLALDEAGLEQHLQMVAHGGLAQSQRLGQIAHAGLAVGLSLDEAEQAKAGRIGENLEGGRELLRLVGLDRRLQERRAGSRDRGECLHRSILTAIDHYGKIPR